MFVLQFVYKPESAAFRLFSLWYHFWFIMHYVIFYADLDQYVGASM